MEITLNNPGTWRKVRIMQKYNCTMDEARRLKAGETVDLGPVNEVKTSVEHIEEETEDYG